MRIYVVPEVRQAALVAGLRDVLGVRDPAAQGAVGRRRHGMAHARLVVHLAHHEEPPRPIYSPQERRLLRVWPPRRRLM